ncbi:similar to Saccharomyces cerevisiae YHL009C YAP3 Basic leucine zipper (bZIP) transcription factor [Maudiozyma saulgeensis]|uniref:Similar to Saccharomyces cerevisiae YHL009C YAP3 Basic leucine zipper (BZIP) transcription factor n=1 Tax=Maudiozyma saulgeensis TaxID=1789683 RepID=A0A1X7R7Y7_9SACH|nr:similar to Saccharomyces cerevisiae YHL009C YAP3 Basic leucine zipper (bZIP) transcription factor [Kazachstania saulgeensis]
MAEEHTFPTENLNLPDMDSQLALLLQPQEFPINSPNNLSNHLLNLSNDERAKKKAQNRAAQRAFRERKMARMKDLQNKLSESEFERINLLKEINQLKLLNKEIFTENDFLKKQQFNINKKNANTMTQSLSPTSPNLSEFENSYQSTSPKSFSFPTKDSFFKSLMVDQFGEEFIQQRYPNDMTYSGVQLLTVPATWEYLQKITEHNNDIEFDMIMVMNNLKRNHVCAEEGPSYPIYLINEMIVQAIEASSSSSS